MPYDNVSIIIQGPSTHVHSVKTSWLGFNTIWSTWVGYEQHYTSEDLVIINTPPEVVGVSNVGYQQKSTLNGIIEANKLGYEYVLKWRDDMVPTNAVKLFELFDFNKINILFWHDHLGGYYVDYMMFGNIQDMLKIWDFKIDSITFPERLITEQIDSLNPHVNLIGFNLTEDNDIIWLKNNHKLSDYKNHINFKHTRI